MPPVLSPPPSSPTLPNYHRPPNAVCSLFVNGNFNSPLHNITNNIFNQPIIKTTFFFHVLLHVHLKQVCHQNNQFHQDLFAAGHPTLPEADMTQGRKRKWGEKQKRRRERFRGVLRPAKTEKMSDLTV